MSAPSINYNEEYHKLIEKQQTQAGIDELFIGNMVEGLRKHRLNLEKNVILLWILSQHAYEKRYEYDGRLEWLLENREILLLPEKGHDCAKRECHQFPAQPGQRLHYSITGETVDATGDIYVCALTGIAHLCPARSNCSHTIIDRNDQKAGYYCSITGRTKHCVVTTVEGYNAERPIGRDKLDKKMRDEEDGMNEDNGAEDFEGYDMEEDSDSAEAVAQDNEWKDEMFERRSKNHLQQDTMLESTGQNLGRILRDAHKAAIGGESLAARVPRIKPAAPKVQRNIRTLAEMSADERVALHLKDLDKKQQLAKSIVRLILTFEPQCRLYKSKLDELAGKATARVNSQISKAKRCLTTIDCDNIFLCFIQESMPRQPRVVKGLYFGRYTNAIMQMWLIVSQSPYARTATVRKQPPLRFDKVAFGLLYKIAGGGYTITCSLPEKYLQHFNIEEELPDLYAAARDNTVDVISHDPTVTAAIVDSTLLVELRNFTLTNAQPDSKTVNEGFKLLESCYKSIFKELAVECIKHLQNGEDKKLSVQAYLDSCVSKKIPSTRD